MISICQTATNIFHKFDVRRKKNDSASRFIKGQSLWNGGKFDILSKFDLEFINIQNKMDDNQGVLFFLSKFDASSLNRCKLSCRKAHDWHANMNRWTHTGNDNTRRPKLASGKNITEDHYHNNIHTVRSLTLPGISYWMLRAQSCWGGDWEATKLNFEIREVSSSHIHTYSSKQLAPSC